MDMQDRIDELRELAYEMEDRIDELEEDLEEESIKHQIGDIIKLKDEENMYALYKGNRNYLLLNHNGGSFFGDNAYGFLPQCKEGTKVSSIKKLVKQFEEE